ncbi:16S rRNA (adenine(1518)-N(6)/adenine(1519)-N(6))-dimethyltransferase RsmA [Clostridium oryzae]|uniref:Ribosomal RNA small subunit methyltransferase A n=1 Tax=Clostridium oryzae TaxID=1450648 RepID=A0A1V4IMN6_9CLOT|nr:16S rRNA (adenine(1518)-N(6)/adenine(1519)-N(6))-dimethyltransferase RsmA [Clostridium oryzae]OPJ61291.1 ribosomal RNA small subunit methyltransferase A [Clostridium oryzae]
MNYNRTQDIVKKYGFRFTKSLGQNFLTDESVLEDIVSGASVDKDDFVIEIGPGVGALTRELLEKAKAVCAVEIDNTLIPILKEELKEFPNFTLINDDALKIDFNEIIKDEKSVKLVANLPYYVTTPIVVKLLKEKYPFKSITIMIQKEVAERMNASAGGKDYGALSLLVKYYCKTEIIRKVSPACFVPQPKVESSVIKLEILEKPAVNVVDEKLFFEVIKSAFSMRRKTLSNSLKNLKYPQDIILSALENCGIDSRRRAETLSIEEFAALSDEIARKVND